MGKNVKTFFKVAKSASANAQKRVLTSALLTPGIEKPVRAGRMRDPSKSTLSIHSKAADILRTVRSGTKLATELPPKVQVPAYKKYAHLLQVSNKGQSRPKVNLIPQEYLELLELYKALNTVLVFRGMTLGSDQWLPFDQVAQYVQNTTRRMLGLSDLARIVALSRDFRGVKFFDLQYMQTERKDSGVHMGEPKQKLHIRLASTVSARDTEQRQEGFINALFLLTEGHHRRFLREHNIHSSIDYVREGFWHVDFDLEKCPPVPEGKLPQPPEVLRVRSAQQLLRQVPVTGKVRDALGRAVEAAARTGARQPRRHGVPEHIFQAVAETARKRQKAKSYFENVGFAQDELRLLRRAPDVIRGLGAVLTSERRRSMPTSQLVEKVARGTDMDGEDVSWVLNKLADWAPELVSVTKTRSFGPCLAVSGLDKLDLVQKRVTEKLEQHLKGVGTLSGSSGDER